MIRDVRSHESFWKMLDTSEIVEPMVRVVLRNSGLDKINFEATLKWSSVAFVAKALLTILSQEMRRGIRFAELGVFPPMIEERFPNVVENLLRARQSLDAIDKSIEAMRSIDAARAKLAEAKQEEPSITKKN